MGGKVIQASFSSPHPEPVRRAPPIQAKAAVTGARLPGPPAPAFAQRSPGAPPRAAGAGSAIVQRHGGAGSFSVEPAQLGLAPGRGRPLPDAVRGKMEAAFGADFSAVRVHVGPQAERIGATAFTVGTDIYFAPNRYQPHTNRGQQLLGHELAHVIQQRAGRVQNPFGSGFAVVRDARLEAEADRLGARAAAHSAPLQAKPARLPRTAIQRVTVPGATIQRATSQKLVPTSFFEDIYYARHLSKEELAALAKNGLIPLGAPPLHGSFAPASLNADLHVKTADQGMNVSGKMKDALTRIKYYMEYAAAIRGKDVRQGCIELRPTGGVVVKQMIELLAFAGLGFFDKMALKKKLDKLKEIRNYRLDKARQALARLQQQIERSGGNLILSLVTQHPHVEESPSPGMGELIRRARLLEAEIKAETKRLKLFAGKRTGHAMGTAFFDEHFYMLHALIGRGRVGYFTVSAFGLARDLDENDPDRLQLTTNLTALTENTALGDRARSIYRDRLNHQEASLRINIYYAAIDDILAAIP